MAKKKIKKSISINHSDLLENLPIIEMANLSKRIYIAD